MNTKSIDIVTPRTANELDALRDIFREYAASDLVANSGRFRQSLPLLLLGPSAFAAFLAFADWLWQRTGETSHLTPEQLVDALFDYLVTERQLDAHTVRQALLADYLASGARARPHSLREVLPAQGVPVARAVRVRAERQARHSDTPDGAGAATLAAEALR